MSAVDDDERRAIIGLALASLPKEDEARVRAALAKKAKKTKRTASGEEPASPLPGLAESLGYLSRQTLVRGRTSHRVLTLDLVAKMAARRGTEALDQVSEHLTAFSQLAVLEADGAVNRQESSEVMVDGEAEVADAPPPAPPSAVPPPPVLPPNLIPDPARVKETVAAFYNAAVPGEHHWRRFTEQASTPLNLTPEEIHRPLCTDHEDVLMPGRKPAVRTAVWMWTDEPVSAFDKWTDPRQWANCGGLFFRSVVPTGNGAPPTDAEFTDVEFTETVNVDGENDLSTKLVFTRSVDAQCFALEFRLPDPVPTDGPLLVDCGQVTARHDPHAPSGRGTSLLAEKFVRFRDPAYATWPTVACDLFWTEFTIIMATGC